MTILNVLLEITAYSAILFAVTLLFKKLLKGKLSPAMHLAVWMLLIVRLMLPVTFDTAVRFFTLPDETIQIDSSLDDIAQNETVQSLRPKTEAASQPTTASSGTSTAQERSHETMKLPANAAAPVKMDWTAVLVAVWIAGMIVCAGMAVYGYSRIRRKLKRDALQPPEALEALFHECRSELEISGRVRLSVQRFAQSPALLFPSMVLVPISMLDMEHEKVKLTLMHELMHYKRKDQLFAMLLLALRIIYWFNPVVHLAERIIRDDIETACDSSVVRRLSAAEKGIYARALIAMYNSAHETQMVLGMALGGTRKGAEKRIRGIYMKQKSQWHVKLTAMLLAGVMVVCCFTTACQPTPDKPVIVNKNQSYDDIISADMGQIEESLEPYTVPERLTESIEDGKLTIHADVSIELPQTTDFPVTMVKHRILSQDEVDNIVNFFTKGRKMYKRKMIQTKDEILDWITQVKRGPLVNGVYDASQVDKDYLKQLEQQYEEAPESFEKQYVDSSLDYCRDYNGKQLQSGEKTALDVNIENDTGNDESLSIMNANNLYHNSIVGYSDGSVHYSETIYREDLDATDIDVETDPSFRDWENQIKNTSMSQDEAIAQGDAVLQALHIDGLALTCVDRAAMLDAGGYPCKGGYQLTYMRSKGKLTGYDTSLWMFDSGDQGEAAPAYVPPFSQEKLTIMLNEDGIHSFYWDGAATEDQTIHENARLKPFEEIKKAALNQIKYKYSFRQNANAKLRCEIESVKLQLGYIGVKDDINKALMVPMWVFVTRFYEKNDSDASEFRYGYEAFVVNALDGSIVSAWPRMEDTRIGV